MSIFDIMIIVIIGVCVFLALRSIKKSRSAGGCCGDCRGCSRQGGCMKEHK